MRVGVREEGGGVHKLFEKRVTGRSVDDFIERGGFSERCLSLVQRRPRGPAARSEERIRNFTINNKASELFEERSLLHYGRAARWMGF